MTCTKSVALAIVGDLEYTEDIWDTFEAAVQARGCSRVIGASDDIAKQRKLPSKYRMILKEQGKVPGEQVEMQ